MMKRFVLTLFVLLFGVSAFAQDIEPIAPPAAAAEIAISFPPPVYLASGDLTIAGSARVQGQTNYFIEFRPLVFDGTGSPDDPWFPATLPSTSAINNNVLGVWNTTTAPDGMYEVRLVVNVRGQQPQYFRVAPIRVLNDPAALSPFATVVAGGTGSGTTSPNVSAAQATQQALATLFASQNTPVPGGGNPVGVATLAPSGTPRVVALTDANVRRGDSTAYPRVDSLLAGQTADIIGISSQGTGWYYIQLPDGDRGFISPSTVRVEGNVVGIQRINPPPVPATPTPVATATPITSADLVISGINIVPNPALCGQPFDVFVNVTNLGTGIAGNAAQVQFFDRHIRTGQIAQTGTVLIPALSPGQNWVATVQLNVGIFVGEEHEIIATVDFNSQVPETNEGNNSARLSYILGSGAC
jgi:hypothetical protein